MAQHKRSTHINGTFSKKRLVPLVFFLIFPPIGIALLIRDLLLESKEIVYLSTVHGVLPMGARTLTPQDATSSQKSESLTLLKQKKKNLMVWGTILTVVFGFSTLMPFFSNDSTAPNTLFLLVDFVSTTGGLLLLYMGQRVNQKIRSVQKYLDAMGDSHTISVSSLASAIGHSPQQVKHFLQDMLNEGCFPYGFLDQGNDILIVP